MHLIGQGAEGRVFSTTLHGKQVVIKERLSKRYRVQELDTRITKQRLIQEARCMAKCRRAGILTPIIYILDKENAKIYMEYIPGDTVKSILLKDIGNNNDLTTHVPLAKEIGKSIALMHDANIIHGDLTTSNLMVNELNSNLVVIDFGLGSMKPTIEDKAVDLYVLERAFLSTHPNTEYLMEEILESYKIHSQKSNIVIEKLVQVRLRGRKRDMVG